MPKNKLPQHIADMKVSEFLQLIDKYDKNHSGSGLVTVELFSDGSGTIYDGIISGRKNDQEMFDGENIEEIINELNSE